MRKPLATALSGGGEGVAVVGEMVGWSSQCTV
jgi:hypothetical protein